MNVRIEDRTPNIATFIKDLQADPPVKRRYGKIKKIAELSPGDSFDFNGTTYTQTYSLCIVFANIANVG